MMVGFAGFGLCTRCGDTQGPWGWYDRSGWLRDDCAREMRDENNDNQVQEANEASGENQKDS